MNDIASAETQSVDEFLGTETKPRWRRWMKYWLPALVLLGAVIYFTRGEKPGPEYITEPVVERSLDIEVTATGNLRPTNQVDVGSEVSGRIDRIYVDVNDRVARGQVLAQINTDVIQDQIRQGQANVNSARSRLVIAVESWAWAAATPACAAATAARSRLTAASAASSSVREGTLPSDRR